MTELKSCPFCHGEVKSMNIGFGIGGVVSCEKCKTKFFLPWNECETANDLYIAWNRRAGEEV